MSRRNEYREGLRLQPTRTFLGRYILLDESLVIVTHYVTITSAPGDPVGSRCKKVILLRSEASGLKASASASGEAERVPAPAPRLQLD